MAQLAPELPERFLRWRYRDDRHVSFHRLTTLRWLVQRFGYDLAQVEGRAFLMQRHVAHGAA